MSTCLHLDLSRWGLGVGVGTMEPVYQQTELQLAHVSGPSCVGPRALRVLGQAGKLVRQDLTCLAGTGRQGNSVGFGMALGHPTPSHGNEMKTGGRAVTLKPKGRSTFPESLLCDGPPSTAKAARTLADLAGRLPTQGGCPQLQLWGCPVGEDTGCCWEQEPRVGRGTPVLFFCRFRTTGELHPWSLEHGGEPQLWATDTAR